MADPEATLREVHRILKQGGKVLIGDWVVNEGGERGTCFRFTAVEIERFLARAGFQNVNVEWVEPYLVLVIVPYQSNPCTKSKNFRTHFLSATNFTKKKKLVKIRVIRGKKPFGSGLSRLGEKSGNSASEEEESGESRSDSCSL